MAVSDRVHLWKLPGIALVIPLLVGTLTAYRIAPRPLLAVGLVGLGAALGGAPGRVVAIAAVALVLTWSRPDAAAPPPSWIDPASPIELRAELVRSWRRARFGWSGLVRVSTVRQGSRVGIWPARLMVDLGTAPPETSSGPLTLKGHLRRAPGLGNLPPQPPGPWRLRVKSSRLVRAGPGRRPPAGLFSFARRVVVARFDRVAASPGLELARALVLGDSSRLDRDLLLGLRRLGLGHLLAVSGLHVGIVGWTLWWLGRPLPVALRRIAPLAGAVGYLALVGPRPAILRASVMVALAARSLAHERSPQSVNSLALGLAGVLALDPGAVRELGFALTAAATAGIVILGPVLERRWVALPGGPRRALAASVGAQLAAFPWTLSRFHVATPLTAPLNLVAVPWTALTLVAAFLWLAVAAAWPTAAAPLQGLLDLIAQPFSWAIELSPRTALLFVSDLGWWGSLVAAMGLAAALVAGTWWWRGLGLAVAVVALVPPTPRPGLEIAVLDVGQGEAILLRDGHRAALVDGGGWRRVDIAQRVLVPTLARLGVRGLDAVILTHPDLDHCRGLIELGAYLPVGEVWSATGLEPGGCGFRLRDAVGERWRPLWAGREADLGRWQIDTLHPAAATRGDGNDRSLVLHARAGARSFLLTGDVERGSESEILRRLGPDRLRSTILKVAHHGSASSTSEAFLDAVAPRLALVSAGRGNAYGHPSTVVLSRLERHRALVLRTDRDGMTRLIWPPARHR